MIVSLIVFVIVLMIVYYVYDKMQMDANVKNLGYILIGLVAILILLQHLGYIF